jgi:hypothetical protein
MFRTLWTHNVAVDMVTPKMDWSNHELVYLPNFAALDEEALGAIRGVLEQADGPKLVVDGYFGTFAGKGHWSYKPPEGLDDLIDCRLADFDMINRFDVKAGNNVVAMPGGEFELPADTAYAMLEPRGDMQAIAHIGDRCVGVQSADGRFTWYGFSISATSSTNVPGMPYEPTSGPLVHDDVAMSMLGSAGVDSWFEITGDRLVAFRRGSKQGGSLVFLINVEDRIAKTTVKPRWGITTAHDLLNDQALALADGAFEIEVGYGEVGVVHCADG